MIDVIPQQQTLAGALESLKENDEASNVDEEAEESADQPNGAMEDTVEAGRVPVVTVTSPESNGTNHGTAPADAASPPVAMES